MIAQARLNLETAARCGTLQMVLRASWRSSTTVDAPNSIVRMPMIVAIVPDVVFDADWINFLNLSGALGPHQTADLPDQLSSRRRPRHRRTRLWRS